VGALSGSAEDLQCDVNECRTTRTAGIDSRKRSSRNASGYTSGFGVSFRDVEQMVAARGVVVRYERIRCWCDKFGKTYADGLRIRRARTRDKWHLTRFSSR